MTLVMSEGTSLIPSRPTTFVGRRRELTRVKEALAGSRLVTLTGVGGVGKSRLAHQVAAELGRVFTDGVAVVELGSVRTPSLVSQTVAMTLDLREVSQRDPGAVLTGYLAGKSVLLVLDNCEHLLDACTRLVNSLLMVAPGLRILVTSREPLRIGAERVWPVPPLSLPGPDEPVSRSHEALVLFEDRVAGDRPGFTVDAENQELVARLCQRLDGIPLAIELAAVRMRELSLEQILLRLEDRFRFLTEAAPGMSTRHQTLRATVDWSFSLCSEIERRVWARCSVFCGMFDLDAAEYVCAGLGVSEGEVFAAVAGLVDKSVLMREDGGHQVRYRMLETIRQYGRERLAGSGEEGVFRRRHRDHYLRIAEKNDAASGGSRQDELVEAVLADRENMIAALEYCFVTPGEARAGLRLASALWFCWIGGLFLHSGRYWLDRGLAEDREPSPERARALWVNGWVAYLQGDHEGSRELQRECRELAGAIGDESALSHATQFLGGEHMWNGDLAYGTALLDDALNRNRSSGQWTAPALIGFATRAFAAGLVGDFDQVTALLDECRALCEPRGERWALSWAEWAAGATLLAGGMRQEAAEYARSSLRRKGELNDKLGVATVVELLAWIAVSDGEAQRAAVLFGAAGKLQASFGRPLFGSERLTDRSRAERARAREFLGSRGFEAAAKKGRDLGTAALIAFALREADARVSEPAPLLTRRERQVAELVAEGLSNKAIASRLVISRRTAETHLDHILTKLGFISRTQIGVWVAEQRGR